MNLDGSAFIVVNFLCLARCYLNIYSQLSYNLLGSNIVASVPM